MFTCALDSDTYDYLTGPSSNLAGKAWDKIKNSSWYKAVDYLLNFIVTFFHNQESFPEVLALSSKKDLQ